MFPPSGRSRVHTRRCERGVVGAAIKSFHSHGLMDRINPCNGSLSGNPSVIIPSFKEGEHIGRGPQNKITNIPSNGKYFYRFTHHYSTRHKARRKFQVFQVPLDFRLNRWKYNVLAADVHVQYLVLSNSAGHPIICEGPVALSLSLAALCLLQLDVPHARSRIQPQPRSGCSTSSPAALKPRYTTSTMSVTLDRN